MFCGMREQRVRFNWRCVLELRVMSKQRGCVLEFRGMSKQLGRRVVRCLLDIGVWRKGHDLCSRSFVDISFASDVYIMNVGQKVVIGAKSMKVGVAERWTWRAASRRTFLFQDDIFCFIVEVVLDRLRILR